MYGGKASPPPSVPRPPVDNRKNTSGLRKSTVPGPIFRPSPALVVGLIHYTEGCMETNIHVFTNITLHTRSQAGRGEKPKHIVFLHPFLIAGDTWPCIEQGFPFEFGILSLPFSLSFSLTLNLFIGHMKVMNSLTLCTMKP